MQQRELIISYQEFSCIADLPQADKELVEEAIKAAEGSYAPYSKFNVGAAVRMSDGKIFTGANQENAAYPSGLCAERTAMFFAHSHSEGAHMTMIAITAFQNGCMCLTPASPCGACRQVMAEFQTESGKKMGVILAGKAKILKFDKVEDLLPFIFDNLNS